jgi:Flp pilus assembly protein TadD
VAVPKPEVLKGAGEEGVEMMAISVRENLLQGLLSFEGLRPLAAEEVDGLAGSPREIARAAAAQEVLSARLDCPGEICQVALSRIAGEDGRLLWTGSFSAASDQYAVLSEVVRGNLQKAYEGRAELTDRIVPVARPADYAEYLRLRRAWDVRQPRLSHEALLARLGALRGTSPRFVHLYLFESEVLEARYTESRDPGDLERAASGLRRAHELVPGDPRPLLGEFGISLRAGRLNRAERAVRELAALLPGNPQVLVCHGRLFEAQGKPEQAITLLETAVRRQPSWRNLFFLASAQYRLGQNARARDNLDRLLQRNPGHYDAQSLLAQIELLSGDVGRAVDLYQGLTLRHPGMTELSNLGFAQLMLGRYAAAEESFRQALAQEPRNAAVQLNLADALSLQGKRDPAAAVYRQVVANVDPASTNVQDLSARAQALAHLGQGLDAVAAVQDLLRGAPRNPQVAYEVSLVYLLLGDRTAALFNATRALEQGVEPRYFDLPWFDPLRTDPDFRKLLSRRAAESSL